ncbi:MAG: hypothetical protein Q8N22_01240 [bacterium]|nr:hypothetical protein [bacterium]
MAKKTKVGIIGLGYVGGALRHWFEKQPGKYEVFSYDKYKNIGSENEINRAEIIFVAVPTPFYDNGRGYDDSEVGKALENIRDKKIVVLKSTILPGSTDKFQKQHPRKILLHNPEFLRAKTAIKDFLKPEKQLVGYTNLKSRRLAPKILKILPQAPHSKIIKARETEMIKYFSNTFLAARVIFANQIYDLCQKLGGIDFEVIKECVGWDPRIGSSHFNIFTDGYRGYSGGCLIKDTKSFVQLAEKLRVNLSLLKEVDEANEKLRMNSHRR